MASVSTYLNFNGNTEAAFMLYRSVFGGDFNGPIHRFSEMPTTPGQPPLPPGTENMVMHMELVVLGGHVLMGTDAPEQMGFKVFEGNNIHINLQPDTRVQTEALFNGLSEGGVVETPLCEMFWGDYFGSVKDRYGVNWMFNCASKT